jgi:hypothetical protein
VVGLPLGATTGAPAMVTRRAAEVPVVRYHPPQTELDDDEPEHVSAAPTPGPAPDGGR